LFCPGRKILLLFEHLPEAVIIGGAGWWVSGNYACLFAALLSGWLIDVDHLIDFAWYGFHSEGVIDWSLMATGEYFNINRKVIVPFHSWEITLILLAGANALPMEHRLVWFSAAAAHGAHILHDQFTYRVKPLGYSFLVRLIGGFRQENFCHQD